MCGGAASSEVPVVTLERERFVQTVVAEGVLKPVRSTPITAPIELRGPAKIAWLRDDGTRVRKGDVVVRFDPTEMETLLLEGEIGRALAEAQLGQR